MIKKTLASILSTVLLAAPALAQSSAGLTQIGAAGAVRGSIKAVAPNATVGRVIGSGKPLYLNDHVTSDSAGHMQLLLLDETVFTLGPNSDMVLDEFVYDPTTKAGKVAASMVKGTFRFVTGNVARKDPEQMKIKLAVGTIGIRGSVGVVQTGPEGSTVINAGAGGGNDAGESSAGIFAENNGQATNLTKPGSGTTITPGNPPGPAVDMSGQLNSIMGNLAPKTAQGGGNDGGGSDPAAGSGSAGSASGGDTAAGGSLASDSADTGELSESASNTTTNAAQQATLVADGLSQWSDLLAINQGGAWYFSGHSPITCSGGGCANLSSPNNPVGALQLWVDFTARTYGGSTTFAGPSGDSYSFIHIHNITTSGDKIEQKIGLGGSGLNPIPFGTSGAATFTLQSGTNMDSTAAATGTAFFNSGNFNGTTVSFQNSGGVAATSALVNLTFTGTNSSSQSLNSSGTFSAPKQ